MRLIDPCDASRKGTRVDCEPHSLGESLERRIRNRLAKPEMVDDDVHRDERIAVRGAAQCLVTPRLEKVPLADSGEDLGSFLLDGLQRIRIEPKQL